MSDILLWVLTRWHANVDWPAKNYIEPLGTDIGYLEVLPRSMANCEMVREKELRESVPLARFDDIQ